MNHLKLPFRGHRFPVLAAIAIFFLVACGGGGGGSSAPALNRAPTVAQGITDQIAIESEPFSFTLPSNAFADVDAGDALSLSVSGLPSGLTFDGVDTISGTPGGDDVGGYTITVTATDPSSASVSTTFWLAVATAWIPYEYADASEFEALCASPRTGIDPYSGIPFPDEQGASLDENNWLRSWSNDLYLWYDEIVDRNPADFDTPAYFDLLKTFATTPSGNPKDKFHFAMDTAEFQALAQSGVVGAGYGATFVFVRDAPPREVVVAYTEPDTPATTDPANLSRGAKVLEIDGVDVINGDSIADILTLEAGTFPLEPGESHDFTVLDLGSSTERSFTMVSEIVTSVPVQHVGTIDTASGAVGYMLFNDHIATAEQLLIDAVNQLKAEDIVDLVLDLRYNGGGWLAIASQLAYMIAGPGPTAGQTFEEIQFNDKHPVFDPVTGELLTPLEFLDAAIGFSAPEDLALPSLDLTRVYILTGRSTCSASESVINGLRGIDVEVIQIGSTTCGKPYGFYPRDNCGTTYFSINYRARNAKGFGDYTDGFSPSNTDPIEGTEVPGCSVADDLTHGFGDPEEGRLAAALAYRDDGTCPPVSGGLAGRRAASAVDLSAVDGKVRKSAWLENRILGW